MIYTVGSLFAGIGGICLGFKNAGCRPIWANEFDKNACRTYRNNFDHRLIEDDVHNIKNPLDELGYTDIVTSGFPCQAFSVAGYRLGFKDPRGNLFFETARIIDSIKPKAYLLENVRNLVSHDKGRTFKVIEEVMTKQLGYSFIPFILNSKDYGNIPQTRERIYVVGFKDEAGFKHDELLNLFEENKISENSCTLNFKIPEPLPLTKSIYDIINKDKMDEKYYYPETHHYHPIFKEEITKKGTIYQWRRVYVRENKSNVCPTLTANMGTGGHNVPLILDDYGIRKLTPIECAKFQGFPDSFVFPEDMANSHCYKQAGNSVVVPVIKRIAESIVKALDVKYANNKIGNIA